MKKLLSKLAQAVTLVGFLAISGSALAEMPTPPKPIWADSADGAQIAKDARRDPNKYCVDCHGHLSNFEHAGKHFQKDTKSPNTGEQLNCTTCHGNISENHRKGVKDVMRFSAMDKAKNPDLERSPQEQNMVCFACHNPEQLRQTFWAHDTHANKMACVNCHELHPEKEPMKATEPKQLVKLCVDCHGSIHEKKHTKLQATTKDSK